MRAVQSLEFCVANKNLHGKINGDFFLYTKRYYRMIKGLNSAERSFEVELSSWLQFLQF